MVYLDLVEVDVAGELDRSHVDDADGISCVGSVEAHTEGVELSVVGEDLEGLLGVVGGVEELDPGMQLATVGVEEHLDAVDVHGARA